MSIAHKRRLLLSAALVLNAALSVNGFASHFLSSDHDGNSLRRQLVAANPLQAIREVIENMKRDDFYEKSLPCGADDSDDWDYSGTIRYELTRNCNAGEVTDWIINDAREHKHSSLRALQELEGILSSSAQSSLARGQISKARAIIKNMKKDKFYEKSFPCGADDDDCGSDIRYELTRSCNIGEVIDWIMNDAREHKVSSLRALNKLEALLS